MHLFIKPSILGGSVTAPPSKSLALRYLIGAALASGKSVINNLPDCGDTAAAKSCIQALGGLPAYGAGSTQNTVEAHPKTAAVSAQNQTQNTRFTTSKPVLNAGDSAATYRMLKPVLAALGIEAEWQLSDRLKQRLSGAGGATSQTISGMLFALPLLSNDNMLTLGNQSRGYVDMTLGVLAQFGIKTALSGVDAGDGKTNCIFVPGNQTYRAGEFTVEGCWSSAANFAGAGVEVTGLTQPADSLQPDSAVNEILKARVLDCACNPDLAPIFAVTAALRDGGKMLNTAVLRHKESDRHGSICALLHSLGARFNAAEGGIQIQGRNGAPFDVKKPLEGFADHRIVMAAAVAAAHSKRGAVVTDCEAVSKSYPAFWDDFRLVQAATL